MQVEINEVISTVRAVDGDALLAPQTLQRIVTAVIEALENVEAHRERVRAETQVRGGVAEEQREVGGR
jgi:hypothetical protein